MIFYTESLKNIWKGVIRLNNNDGWIKLYRKFKSWGWYQNSNIKSVFIHCLISANFADGEYEGEKIPRGSFVASYAQIAAELGMAKTTLYRSLQQLSDSGEIKVERQRNGKNTVFTVQNYSDYQGSGTEMERKWNDNGTEVERKRNDGGTDTIYKNKKKNKNNKKERNAPPSGDFSENESDTYGYDYGDPFVERMEI